MKRRRARRRGALRDSGKRLWVGDGDVGQHLPVERDARLLEAVDEPRVRHAVDAGGGVDAGDPERAEVPAAHAAAAGRLHQAALDGLDRALVAAVAPAAETLGELEDSISTATCLEPTLDAHLLSSSTTGAFPEARRGRFHKAARVVASV